MEPLGLGHAYYVTSCGAGDNLSPTLWSQNVLIEEFVSHPRRHFCVCSLN